MSLLSMIGVVLTLLFPPFPAPTAIQATASLKCDNATIDSIDAARQEFRGKTPAGTITYRVVPEVPVIGKDGKPAGSSSDIKVGQKVRIYYVLEQGAQVREIDLTE